MKHIKLFEQFILERKIFGDYVFGEPVGDRDLYKVFTDEMQSIFGYNIEKNTMLETQFFGLLINWVKNSKHISENTLDKLVSCRNMMASLKRDYPNFFVPDEEYFFRGINYDISFDTKNYKVENLGGNWVGIYDQGDYFYLCINEYMHKEYRVLSSWSSDIMVARDFSYKDTVLVKCNDDKFFLNTKLTNIIYRVYGVNNIDGEYESIYYGGKKIPVYMIHTKAELINKVTGYNYGYEGDIEKLVEGLPSELLDNVLEKYVI